MAKGCGDCPHLLGGRGVVGGELVMRRRGFSFVAGLRRSESVSSGFRHWSKP